MLYRLEFDDERLIHEQIEAALCDRESFVVHTDGDLALERYLAQMQFYGEQLPRRRIPENQVRGGIDRGMVFCFRVLTSGPPWER